jgi:hypothetical protein
LAFAELDAYVLMMLRNLTDAATARTARRIRELSLAVEDGALQKQFSV